MTLSIMIVDDDGAVRNAPFSAAFQEWTFYRRY